MSTYTTELGYYLEFLNGDVERNDDVNNVIEHTVDKFFKGINDYDCFDETYRRNLNKKILLHFYFREIGFETVALFKTRLHAKMLLIMPYYNKLLKELAKEEHLFDNVNYTIERNRSGNSNEKEDSSVDRTGDNSYNDNNKNRFSDTPQNGLSDIEENRYLTSATLNDGSGASNFSSNDILARTRKNDNAEEEKVKYAGRTGGKSYVELISEFSEKTFNIDKRIIKELEPLFMSVW